MAKVLITGASGLLGANALLQLSETHQVVGVYHHHPVSAPGIRCVAADLSEPGKAEEILTNEQPDWVLHCAALANVDTCEREPQKAFHLNRDMAGYVAAACSAVNARLVHVSTDLVFDGARGNYNEEDRAKPINVYGQSKLAGEALVLENCSQACVIRTNIYGWNARQKLSLAEWFLETLRTQGEAPGFEDMYSTPISVNDLLILIEVLMKSEATGIFHIGAKDCISKLELGRHIASLYGFDPEKVRPVQWRQAGLYADRAENLCLDCQKLVEFCGATLPDVQGGLSRWKALGDSDFHRRLKDLVSADGNEAKRSA